MLPWPRRRCRRTVAAVQRPAPLQVQIAMFDGVDPLDVIAPYEVLWAAAQLSDGAVTVELAAVDGPRAVVTGSGLRLDASAELEVGRADVIVVPGAAGTLGDTDADADEIDESSIPVRLGRTLETDLPDVLRQALAGDVVVACVCGGSLILAMAGLIEGRPAVTHHLGMDLLEATGTRAVAARVVDDGNLITGGGVTSGLDVALHVVERFLGPQVAHAVEELFEFERRGTVWRSTGLVPSPL